MAQIGVPESAKPVCVYTTPDRRSRDDAFFPSFAHMVVFAASVGFEMNEFDAEVKCLKRPVPIEMNYFRNFGLMDYLYILGIDKTKSHEVVNDEDALASIVEGYASAGFRRLAQIEKECGGHDYVTTLIQEILRSQEKSAD